MYLFNLGSNKKWIRNVLIIYYIFAMISVSSYSNRDGLKLISLYIAALLVPHIVVGIIKIFKYYKNKSWILVNLIYPLVAFIVFTLISVDLDKTSYYYEGKTRAFSELGVTDLQYNSEIDKYSELKDKKEIYIDSFNETKDKNGDIDELNITLENRYDNYKELYPESLLQEYNKLIDENSEYTSEIASLESKIEYNNKLVAQNSNNNSTNNNSSSSGGTAVYIANGNNYYHKSSSCKFISGLYVQMVYLEDYPGKHQCNCWHY